MFFGAVPTECIQQVFKIMDIERWSAAYVCCSGSFRLERALSGAFPELAIHSNDVSVYSAVIGGLATGRPVDVRFTGQLAFVEEILGEADPLDRAAAVLVACEMSRYARATTRYNRTHFDYYRDRFPDYLARTRAKTARALETMRVTSYFSGDWRSHAEHAVEAGAGILAFPPFFKGDYEAQFRFIDENITWDAPDYDLYDPSMLREIARGLEARGATYCILTDQLWDDKEPVLKYHVGRKVPHYCYANTPKSSYLRKTTRAQPFRYRPVIPERLTRDSEVVVTQADSAKLSFIKDVYLAKSIVHTAGFGNYLVYIDGMLAGGIVYDEGPVTRMAYGPRTLVLLSDVTTTTAGKISKLVAMMGTCRQLIRPLELTMLKRYERVVTTARTKKHVSMKYRGIFKKLSKRWDEDEGLHIIQYGAPVTDETPQAIYQRWWDKYGPGSR